MPIITGIIAAVSAIGGFLSVAVIGGITVGQLLTGAVLIGSYYYSQMQAKKAKKGAVSGIADPGVQGTTRGSIAPQRTIHGMAFVGGVVFFERKLPPYYFIGMVIAAHEIDAVLEVRINNTPVVLDAEGNVISAPFFTDDGRSLAKISIGLGKEDQEVDPIIMEHFPDVGAGFRQRGHARIVGRFNWGASREEYDKVWSTFPTITVRVRGKKVYNPNDPNQIIDDPSTWLWSSSPTLCAADFLRSRFGGRLPASVFRWQRNAVGALIDLQKVPTLSGVWEQRYSCDGVIDTSASAIDSLRVILTCNRGLLSWDTFGYAIDAGAPRQSCMTIHEALLVAGVEHIGDVPRSETVNVVRTRCVAPDRDFQMVDGPPLVRQDLILSDGAEYAQTLDLPMVEGAPRAQRLAKAFLEDGRRGRTIKTILDITDETIRIEPGDWVTVDLPSLLTDKINGLYEIQSVAWGEAFTSLSVTMVETSADIYQFDPAVDEKPFSFAN